MTKKTRRMSRGSVIIASVLAILGFGAFLVPSISAGGNPPGANGTVKIDRLEFDSHPDNQPHVGCTFQVDFYGFDQGNYTADVQFAVHPPTGKDIVRTDKVFIGEDPAGGGTDLDAERTYDLSEQLKAYTPHPKQGFHVKLTVSAPGADGKVATKHKVFWTQGCETPPPCETDPYTGECYES